MPIVILQLIKNFVFSRFGRYVILLSVISGSLYLLYNNIYSKGFNAGKIEQVNEYNQKIEKILAEQKQLQEKAVKDAVAVAKKQQDIKIIYKDKIVEVEKIINKTEYKECKMPDDEFKSYKDILESIK